MFQVLPEDFELDTVLREVLVGNLNIVFSSSNWKKAKTTCEEKADRYHFETSISY